MTQTLNEELVIAQPQAETPNEAFPQEEVDLERLPKRTPPRKGLCRRCGQDKPINRLMLCYPCWVKVQLERDGWREGQPHPDYCRCEGIGGHPDRRSAGN